MKALLLCLLLIAGPAVAAEESSPETAIRQALATWTEQFNARDTQGVCTLFAPGLRYNVEGLATEQTYQDMCNRLYRALTGREVTYHYRLDIQEIIVSGDIAVVRLVWYDTVSRPGVPDVVTPEQGMDIFRRQDDGSWKIIRYLAYSVQK
jgi:ketosteroid isomerase-like protein